MHAPKLIDEIAKKAVFLSNHEELFPYIKGMSVDAIFDLLLSIEEDKIERDKLTDGLINYNDEIISIEHVGKEELVDISVTGDNLFYANGVLTKNSFGLPATADFMFAMVRTEELDALGQIMIIQLKSRYGDIGYYRKFVIGVDIKKFFLFDVENSAQEDLVDNGPVFDNSKFDTGLQSEKYDFDFS